MQVDERNDRQLKDNIEQKQWKPTWKDISLYSLLGIFFAGQVVLCFLCYNWANLDFLLYLGWAIFAFSMVIGMMSRRAFQEKGRAASGESWLHTTVVVDSGIYAVTRHPIYLSGILFILSLILICQHWLCLIFGIPTMAFFYLSMGQEERSSINKFGDDYRRYMKKVPRINIFLGVIRLMRRKTVSKK